ncbi:MAG: SDR family NAD(P)-dependent oxidoreductase [Actinobacteria bacterium]|nr:SDR family NAD(P)-dependent oxidoreductase [Actinomycetota bacterium]MBU1942079.1 SDR family NAD(P)-dependent oxidoreductase [Actinomycetota bacterium]MBU2688058.1 SDR family NAD(P)-dependent oxidoreductase [Actinomycetota bacterium]
MRDFGGKTALVTGGASGIGRCIALRLAREGCDLALVDLNPEGLERVKVEVESLGRTATTHVVDVTDPGQVDALAAEVSPQVLVNCAGVFLLAEAETTSRAEFEKVIDVNLWGPLNTFWAFLPALKSSGGHIINIASADGLFAIPGSAAYSTSKFGLVGFSEVTGIELAAHGVGVTAVCPGLTWTPMAENLVTDGYRRDRVDSLIRYFKPLVFTTPEKLAAAAVRGAKKNRPVVVHTPLVRLLYFVKRLSPRLYRDLLGRPVHWMIRWASDR